ncbi:Elongation factor Ts, mitochondrial, partial [Cucurbita argyrosperma subsp. sororia]
MLRAKPNQQNIAGPKSRAPAPFIFPSCETKKLSTTTRAFVVKGVQYGGSVPYTQDATSALSSRLSLLRRFSVETPAVSDQMSLIKQLRERTSAPIKDVKAALIDCNWNIEAAQTELRKRGKVLALKKSSRTAAEGLLALAQNETKAVVIELNCETDFVARNEIFQYLALSLARQALLSESSSHNVSGTFPVGLEQLEGMKLNLEHPKISGETTALNAVTEVAGIMGENIKLRRGFLMSASSSGVISTYLHTSPQPGLGRIAGILSLEVEGGSSQSDALQRVGSEIAMHIVAAKPLFLTKELVSSEALKNEREILQTQAETSGKSGMALEKMVEGRLRKYMEEVVLMEQKFIVNDSINIKTLLENLSKEVGSPVKIGNFLRVGVGEGIERLDTSDSSEPVAQAA